jgi:hypothetical protein
MQVLLLSKGQPTLKASHLLIHRLFVLTDATNRSAKLVVVRLSPSGESWPDSNREKGIDLESVSLLASDWFTGEEKRTVCTRFET